jgi:hypothetical protein
LPRYSALPRSRCSNYTAFTREVEHSNTAVYFCEGMHNNRQFALKFYASQADFTAEMMAYKELGGEALSVITTTLITVLVS